MGENVAPGGSGVAAFAASISRSTSAALPKPSGRPHAANASASNRIQAGFARRCAISPVRRGFLGTTVRPPSYLDVLSDAGRLKFGMRPGARHYGVFSWILLPSSSPSRLMGPGTGGTGAPVPKPKASPLPAGWTQGRLIGLRALTPSLSIGVSRSTTSSPLGSSSPSSLSSGNRSRSRAGRAA